MAGRADVPTPHDAHDPGLVAAYAAGDAAGAELAAATTLVASCPDCAALHRDLRAIAASIATLPAPVRTRDFRLTADQAAALRPAGWRRFAAAFAGPSFRFATPLGTGLAALGLAGVLLGSVGGPLLGLAGGSATAMRANEKSASSNDTSAPYAPVPSAAASAFAVQSAAPSAAPSAGAVAESTQVPAAASAAPSGQSAPNSTAPSAGDLTPVASPATGGGSSSSGGGSNGSAGGAPANGPDSGVSNGGDTSNGTGGNQGAAPRPITPTKGTEALSSDASPLAVAIPIGVVVLLVGVALVALRLGSRRVA